MTQRIIPMGDRLLVRPHAVQRKTGGLSVPGSQEEEPTTGVVVAIGPEAYDIELGWVVVWRQHAGYDVIIDGETLKTLRLEEIEHRLVEE